MDSLEHDVQAGSSMAIETSTPIADSGAERPPLFSGKSASDGGRSRDVYTTSSPILEADLSSALNEHRHR